jgi:hypothetical protein
MKSPQIQAGLHSLTAHDFCGSDHLAGVPLGVLGGVEEEAERRARQPRAADRSRLEEGCFRPGAQLRQGLV